METVRFDELEGNVLEGKYRLERVIGRGGMAVVYEATHLGLDRRVAVKMLSGAMAERSDMARRMIREAKTASAIGHPNIVLVTDLGWHLGAPFVVMEYLQGVTLAAELSERGPMPPAQAIAIMLDVLDALDAVHRRGIVHRDIKPQNVMLVRAHDGKRVVKVLDFGISKAPRDDANLTKDGAVMGTPAHMAPEQALGERADARADIFAAGSLLYTLLVGESPFLTHSSATTIARLLDGRYTPAGERVAGVTPRLDQIIAIALAREPAARYRDAATMREALLAYRQELAAPGRGAAPALRAPTPAPPPGPIAATSSAAPADARFAPPPVARLDLDAVLDRPRPGAHARGDDARGPIRVRTIAWLLGAIAAAVITWQFRAPIARFARETGEAIGVLVAPEQPRDTAEPSSAPTPEPRRSRRR
ncbi:MAG: serine/threonine protein kinase [Nannocystaceae bacterium]|nr:serine/threonine protein kinase [Nannocystaceae bacterium]